jgi:uncharacterized protein (TIGR00251 family)
MATFAKIKLTLKEKGVIYFNVKVRPSAAKSRVVGELDDETIKIDLAAPAEKGKANEELIKFLAKELAIPQTSIKIVAGKGERKKLVKITL